MTAGQKGLDQSDELVTLTGTSEAIGFRDGPGPLGQLKEPTYLVSDGSHLYIIEGSTSNRLRALDMATGIIQTIAGGGRDTCVDGVGKAAMLNRPHHAVVDPSHENLYLADTCGLRKVVIASGEVSTLIQSNQTGKPDLGDGSKLQAVGALALDSTGRWLYVADAAAYVIRVMDLSTSALAIVAGSATKGDADGVGKAATLCRPTDLALDPSGTKLYFADICENDVIRVVDIPSGEVKTLFGYPSNLNGDDGVGVGAGFFNLRNIAIDAAGANLYTSEASGGRQLIRKLDLTTLKTTTLAGSRTESGSADGTGTDARFDFPLGLTIDGNSLYVADSGNEVIRKIALDTNQVTTYAGSNAPATFNDPVNIVSDGTYLYVVDKNNNAIRKVSMASGYAMKYVGGSDFGHADGKGLAATFNFPSGITIAGSHLYVADTSNHAIRAVDLATSQVTTLAGSSDNQGSTDGIGTSASFNLPQGLVADPAGQNLYIADQYNHEIRKIVIATGQVTTIAGATDSGFVDGIGNAARFNMPANLAIDPQGTSLLVTDASNNAIRKINLATAQVTTVAGDMKAGHTNGIGKNASFDTPWGIATDGTYAYVADGANGLIRKIDLATAAVSIQCGRTTFDYEDGTCAKALFQAPAGLTLDPTGSWLYICDSRHNQIQMIRVR